MRTNLKKRPLFLFGVFFAALFGITSPHGFALTVANGGFDDLTGLTAQGGGWYQGVPAGWTSSASNPGWAVFNGAGNPAPTINLNTLSTLRQNAGTNAVPSLVTLTFDIGAFSGAPSATVKITDGGSTIYGSGTYPVGNGQTLSAYTPANVPIYIEFGGGQVAWVDNVSVSSTPGAPGLSLTNGNFADLSGTTDTGNGWFGGIPAGWSTTAPTNGYAIRTIGGTNYANLNTLGTSSGGLFHPLRQDLGTASAVSDVTISFKATSLTANPYYLASAIYSKADPTNALAVFETPALIQGPSTITYSARNVTAGTELYVAFWTTSGFTPGITDVTVSTAVSTHTIDFASNAVFALDPSQPVSSNFNFNFEPGSKIKVVGTNAPSGSAVRLLSTGGTITGSPALESAVNGYELALSAGNVLWLRQGLAVINGNFQDATGLRDIGGGWYAGVPSGWTGVDGSYSVMNWNSGDLAANLQVVGPGGSPFQPFYQSAGLLDSAAVISLSFDILTFVPGYDVRAGIYNTNGSSDYSSWTALALPPAGYTTGGRYTLETTVPIPSGTLIGVAFWQGAGGAAGIDNVALSVTYANRAPTDISLSGASISENNLVGDVVGTLSATDPDAGDTHNFSLVSGDGGTDNASFEIDGSTLKANVVFDHETQASYSIRVRSTDGGGLTTEKTFTITVIDVAEQTPQQAYLASFGLSGDDLLGTADPDGDGMDNDAEFAFGTNPVSGASRAATLSSGTGTIKITYLQRNSGVIYTVKSLPNLTTAFDSGTTVNPVASSPQPTGLSSDYTQYEASVSTGSTRGFLRVRAVAD